MWKMVKDQATGRYVMTNDETGESRPPSPDDFRIGPPAIPANSYGDNGWTKQPRIGPPAIPGEEAIGPPAIPGSSPQEERYVVPFEDEPRNQGPSVASQIASQLSMRQMGGGMPPPPPEKPIDHLNYLKSMVPGPGMLMKGGFGEDVLKMAGVLPKPAESTTPVAPSQRLQPEPTKPVQPVAATQPQSTATMDPADYRDPAEAKPASVGPAQNDGISRTTPQQTAYDYATRYQKASEAERRAIRDLGFARDMADAMGKITSGAHIRLGLKPRGFETNAAEANLASATHAKNELGQLEEVDPGSARSQNLRAMWKANPVLQGMAGKVQNFDNMSFQELQGLMPLGRTMIEEAGSRERAEMLSGRYGRLRQPEMTALISIKNGLNAVERLRSSFRKDKDQGGPIEGRLQRALIRVGIAGANEAVTNANAVDMAAQYIKSISGAQVSDQEYKRLMQMIPSISQDPEQFEALLNNFEDVLRGQGRSIIDITASQGYNTEGTEDVVLGKEQAPAAQPQGDSDVTILRKDGGDPPVLKIPKSHPQHDAAVKKATSQGYK